MRPFALVARVTRAMLTVHADPSPPSSVRPSHHFDCVHCKWPRSNAKLILNNIKTHLPNCFETPLFPTVKFEKLICREAVSNFYDLSTIPFRQRIDISVAATAEPTNNPAKSDELMNLTSQCLCPMCFHSEIESTTINAC